MNTTIVTSKWFDSADLNILHIPHPSMEALYALFIENPTLEEIIVSDCVKELYEEDIQEILKKKTLKTHVQGVYYIHKSTSFFGKGNSWEEIIENLILDENQVNEKHNDKK
jgi:hypothetical protein